MDLMFIFCVFQYGRFAKIISGCHLVGPSLPRPTLFCFGLVWSNPIAGKMYPEMDIRRVVCTFNFSRAIGASSFFNPYEKSANYLSG